MKVGILTFHKAKNYGAVLQTFALQTVLKKLGTNPYIINRYTGHEKKIRQIYFIFHPKLILSRLIWVLFDQFSKKYLIPKTKKYNTICSLKNFEENEKLDAAIVGSDQVWRIAFSSIGNNYFFDFIKGNKTRKISYAASFGYDEWTENESVTNKIKELLLDFSSVSVREKSGVKICSDIFNKEATNVLDPTLLLKREDYESILLKGKAKKTNNTLVSYMLGNNKELKDINQFAKTNDLDYLDLYFTYPLNAFFSASIYGKKHYLHISVPDWLMQIRNAKYVITNSYHATIFAILFGKQFIVIDHPSGGTDRITSLLGILGLQDRFISETSAISINLLNKNINFDLVNLKLERERDLSILFLQKSLF